MRASAAEPARPDQSPGRRRRRVCPSRDGPRPGEDVAAVERRRRDRQPEVAVLERRAPRDPAEPLRRRDQQPVVRPDKTSPRPVEDGDRPPVRAHAGIDDRDVEPDREVRQRAPQEERAVADRELPDLVADVDDPGVRARSTSMTPRQIAAPGRRGPKSVRKLMNGSAMAAMYVPTRADRRRGNPEAAPGGGLGAASGGRCRDDGRRFVAAGG